MYAIASELWEQLIREEEAGRIASFVRLSIADGVESSENRKDAEQYLELAMYMSCDQRLKNALGGKNYREAYAELSRRLDRDADVYYVTKLTSFTWKKGDDMDFEPCQSVTWTSLRRSLSGENPEDCRCGRLARPYS